MVVFNWSNFLSPLASCWSSFPQNIIIPFTLTPLGEKVPVEEVLGKGTVNAWAEANLLTPKEAMYLPWHGREHSSYFQGPAQTVDFDWGQPEEDRHHQAWSLPVPLLRKRACFLIDFQFSTSHTWKVKILTSDYM